jgi:peptidoglycan/LPS O-acetylase OafA/YrhL
MNESPMKAVPLRTGRANGLDTLRATAITLVFMYHYMVFVSREPTFGWASTVGWVGVDLFFVLSGYLIANQIFAGLARGERLSLKAFYVRRAIRTLPVFWVVLALYFLFPAVMGGRTPPPLWSFLTFTQNFNLQPGTAFSHAWSLCIEEQFYLVLPLVIVTGARFASGRMQGWMLIAALLTLGITARILWWRATGTESTGRLHDYYPNVYYATLCRFDEFLPGVAVAMLKNFHRPAWERITRHGQAMLAAGAVCTAIMLTLVFNFYYIDNYGYGFFMTAFGYSLIAMAFAVLVVAALSPASWLYRVRIPGAYHIALWSYSIYLSHKAIAFILQQQLKAFELPGWMLVAAVTASSLLAGWLLYRLVETPFMAIRDQRFPTSFPAVRQAGGVALAGKATPSGEH